MMCAAPYFEPVAVVGLACRVPGAEDAAAFWRNISEGVVSIERFSRDALERSGVDPELLAQPNYVPVGGQLASPSMFDAEFFSMTDGEARLTDPQHRLLMELAWEALEDAACNPFAWPGRIGCFAGAGMTLYAGRQVGSYLSSNLLRNPDALERAAIQQIAMANLPDYLATKIAYRFNLRGPAATIQTACSTGLAAVHIAISSLRLGECDLALAGAAAIYPSSSKGYLADGGILSPEGVCRPFDAGASGTVGGAGGGVVALRLLRDALRDGDAIHAVIAGSAMNNDGSGKVSFTAPGFEGQCDAIRRAMGVAGVVPASIGLLETHGTGTKLGDAVEIASLAEVFGPNPGTGAFCAIGATKANIGHLDTAAGIVGFIKAVLAVEHGAIPPLAGLRQPIGELTKVGSAFYAPTALTPWSAATGVRRAGVSSFGAGGTNVHVVLEQAPDRSSGICPVGPEVIVISARTSHALSAQAARFAGAIDACEDSLGDIAYTAAVGRVHNGCRAAFVSTTREEAVAELIKLGSAPTPETGQAAARKPRLSARPAFIFPGQGSLSFATMRDLRRNKVFDATFTACARTCARLGVDIDRALLDGENIAGIASLVQPLLVAGQISLSEVWRGWGVIASAVMGHSLGEYAAAYVAGALDIETCLTLACARGALMEKHCAADGVMIAVDAPGDQIAGAIVRMGLEKKIAVAAYNAPGLSVVSGDRAACEILLRDQFGGADRGVELHVSHAFHSPAMDAMLDDFRRLASSAKYLRPTIPFYSTVTGELLTAFDAEYLTRQIRLPVRFADALSAAASDSRLAFIDMGIGRGLETLCRRNLDAYRPVIAPLWRDDAIRSLKGALGKLYVAGAEIDWGMVYAGSERRRIRLPPYPFERRHYWTEAVAPDRVKPNALTIEAAPAVAPSPQFWHSTWQPFEFEPAPAVCLDDVRILASEPSECVWLRDSLVRAGANAVIAPLRTGKYVSHRAAKPHGVTGPRIVLYLGNPPETAGEKAALVEHVVADVASVVSLIQTLVDENGLDCRITIVTAPPAEPSFEIQSCAAAAVWAAVRSVRAELPQLSINLLEAEFGAADATSRCVLAGVSEDLCRRGDSWLTPALRPAKQMACNAGYVGQCILIAGGRGGIGRMIASHLLRNGAAAVVLLGRNDMTAEDRIVADSDRRVIHVTADISDEGTIDIVLANLANEGLALDGIVHAAGTLSDGSVVAQSEERILEVCLPKLSGAAYLLQLARRSSAKWLVALSSAAAVFGAPGQLNYAAANAAMTAYLSRPKDGLAISIMHLGPVEGSGMKLGGRAQKEHFVFEPVTVAAFLDAFDRLASARSQPMLVAVLRAGARSTFYSGSTLRSLEAELWRTRTSTSSIASFGAPDRSMGLALTLRSEIAGMIGIPATEVDPDRPFFDLGMDSLMIVNLRLRLAQMIGRAVPHEMVFNAPTLNSLVLAIQSALSQAAQ